MTLEDVLDSLAQHPAVDGTMVIGSAARGELSPSSDYDLVIVLSDMPVSIDIGLTFIDQRLTNLVFVTAEEIDQFLETEEPVDPYTSVGRAIRRMGDGEVQIDRSGRLERARQKTQRDVQVKLLSERENGSRWWMLNYHLKHSKRLLASDDPINAMAIQLRLVGMTDYLMFDYFNFRNLEWRGE